MLQPLQLPCWLQRRVQAQSAAQRPRPRLHSPSRRVARSAARAPPRAALQTFPLQQRPSSPLPACGATLVASPQCPPTLLMALRCRPPQAWPTLALLPQRAPGSTCPPLACTTCRCSLAPARRPGPRPARPAAAVAVAMPAVQREKGMQQQQQRRSRPPQCSRPACWQLQLQQQRALPCAPGMLLPLKCCWMPLASPTPSPMPPPRTPPRAMSRTLCALAATRACSLKCCCPMRRRAQQQQPWQRKRAAPPCSQ